MHPKMNKLKQNQKGKVNLYINDTYAYKISMK